MKTTFRTLISAIAFVFGLNMAASAQPFDAMRTGPVPGEQIAVAAPPAAVLDATRFDLSQLDEATWQDLEEETIRGLWSRRAENRMQAIQNILMITYFAPGKIDFTGAVERLGRLAAFEREEGLQIMAVAALRAIDSPEAMGQLVGLMELRQPERVEEITRIAVADYAQAGMRAVL